MYLKSQLQYCPCHFYDQIMYDLTVARLAPIAPRSTCLFNKLIMCVTRQAMMNRLQLLLLAAGCLHQLQNVAALYLSSTLNSGYMSS